MVTYFAVYEHPKVPDPITIHALTPQPLYRTFRAAGGKRRFKRVRYKATRRKVVIVAKSAKSRTRKGAKNTIVDEELEDLEELEELDDLEDEEEPDDDEEEDEDDDDEDEEDDEDSDELDDLNVKDLRAKARALDISVKGLNKQGLIDAIRAEDEESDDDEDDEDEEEDDDEEEVEEAPKSKKGKSSSAGKSSTASKKKASGSSRSRTSDGKVGVQEVAEAAGTDPRKLRMVLRKHEIEKDEDVGRYEWSSMNHPEVKKILKLVKGGAVKEATKESLDKLKSTGKKKGAPAKATTDAPRKKKKRSSR